MTDLMDPSTDAPMETPCRLDPGAWFPEGGYGSYTVARAWCQQCPVQAACLRAALDMEGDARRDERFGMWGGTTPQERHQMWKEAQG